MLKVYINCKSQLLQKSVEIFLKKYTTTYKRADVVITDKPLKANKPVLTIGSGKHCKIKKPFTQSSLMLILDRERKILEKSRSSFSGERVDLENQIEQLTQKFAKDLAKILKSRI